MNEIRIGTRKSKLALWQTNFVSDLLRRHYPGITVAHDHVTTKGDRVLDRPLAKIGDKGLFTQELEDRLLSGEIDMAVHSLKDLPTHLPDGLMIGAILARVSPDDVLVSGSGKTLAQLPAGARIGTSSVRRIAQLLRFRPDLKPVDIRGNVDTRLAKLDDGLYDALILAQAGLTRLGSASRITEILDHDWYYAVGQGALAIEIAGRRDDVKALLEPLQDHATTAMVEAERAFLRLLEGGCQVPVGVRTSVEDDRLTLHGIIVSLDGSQSFLDSHAGPVADADRIGRELGETLVARGAEAILKQCRNV